LAGSVDDFVGVTKPGYRVGKFDPDEKISRHACYVIGSRDVVEEFCAARIAPLSVGWSIGPIEKKKLPGTNVILSYPRFGVSRPAGVSDINFVGDVEKVAEAYLAKYDLKEHASFFGTVGHNKRVNRVFDELNVEYVTYRDIPGKPAARLRKGATNTGAEVPATSKASKKRKVAAPLASAVRAKKVKAMAGRKAKTSVSSEGTEDEMIVADSGKNPAVDSASDVPDPITIEDSPAVADAAVNVGDDAALAIQPIRSAVPTGGPRPDS
jgi:hypothetical protein